MERPRLETIKKTLPLEAECPALEETELDEICDLSVAESEIQELFLFFQDNRRILWEVLLALRDRNFRDELPVTAPAFLYQRNLKECRRLRRSVMRLLVSPALDFEDEEKVALLSDVFRLMVLERRKAAWLEKNFYPATYRRAIAAARGEVNQFLIHHKNTAGLKEFRDTGDAHIVLRDEINYLMDGHPPATVGVAWGDNVMIRIPEYYSDRNEWGVYLVAVHELVHYASGYNCWFSDVDTKDAGPDGLREIREATTEIITLLITRLHVEKHKTKLYAERPIKHSEAAYGEFIVVLKQLFPKIPESLFIDALLNENGLERLREEFAKVFQSPEALREYGRKLRGIFQPRRSKK